MTFVLALCGVVVLSLVLRGFLPYLRAERGTAAWYMAMFFVVKSLVGIIRMGYWDVGRPLWRYANGQDWQVLDAQGVWVNTGLAIGAIVCGLFGLMALWRSIPDDERHNYSLITAPFYR